MNDSQSTKDFYDLSSEARVEASAKEKGAAIVWPKANELFLDLDSEIALAEALGRVSRLAEIVPGLKVARHWQSKTPGHFHMVCVCDGPLDEEGRVFLELALGSDPKRALLGMHEIVAHDRERVSCFFEPKAPEQFRCADPRRAMLGWRRVVEGLRKKGSCFFEKRRNMKGTSMNTILRITIVVAFLAGCSPTTYSHGIANLAQVDKAHNIWRSGQPVTAEDWAYVKSLGVRTIVKLNFEDEGSDAGAHAAGLTVLVLSVEPRGDLDLVDNVTHTFIRPDGALLDQAERALEGGDVLVHCTHGQDRTGTAVGMYRVRHDGWTKDQAYAEMLTHGYHPELHGLHEFWENWNP